MGRAGRAQPTFYEFFAGGGMARAGLGAGWRCLFANDFDARKAASYRANWGDAEMRCGDIHALSPADLPDHADLAWASFPCQDLSLAGGGAGLAGARSGAFWGFHALIDGLRGEHRPPRLLVLENVGGALTSKGGRDFEALCAALARLGYVFGALMLDAERFLPQSRPRVFFVAAREELPSAPLATPGPGLWTTESLRSAQAMLPAPLAARWRWWRLPEAPARRVVLRDLIQDSPNDVAWHTPEETAYLLSLMAPPHRAKLEAAKASGRREVGALYRRTRRTPDGGKAQRAEVRFDGVAGCLRTASGGSSRQTIVVVEGERIRTRLLSAREAARLMGLPDSYVLPTRYNDAYHLAGDGLAVPVVAHLREHLLEPLLDLAAPLDVAAE
ncbi:DNA (cytosine-5-)-methyltransferase [Alsobacter soli]|uniref:DNA (cytosine-5-)-methyltransferase n=1 Tax=Alsobacter soli TaxID=2109933 RepID=A0A2T1HT31_9HYPH|nr:DNA cytosine methyltransferase [Alsobacter soli]PSC04821.1 DNA (cytosine-5-)-methyltransferase [Alsobacter soli]